MPICWCPALSPAGNEALILLAIHQGLVHPCFSEEILEEPKPRWPFKVGFILDNRFYRDQAAGTALS
jgi:hypothetical protein